MKPYIHAQNSAKKYGGVPEDYLEIHDMMDFSKAGHASVRHRSMFHHAQGIFVMEKIFGHNITNSDGKLVSVRDVAEDHVLEDLGVIPSFDDYMKAMTLQEWMGGEKKSEVKAIDRGNIFTQDKPPFDTDRINPLPYFPTKTEIIDS